MFHADQLSDLMRYGANFVRAASSGRSSIKLLGFGHDSCSFFEAEFFLNSPCFVGAFSNFEARNGLPQGSGTFLILMHDGFGLHPALARAFCDLPSWFQLSCTGVRVQVSEG